MHPRGSATVLVLQGVISKRTAGGSNGTKRFSVLLNNVVDLFTNLRAISPSKKLVIMRWA